MNNQVEANQLVIGILAHVDAGKTTLAESILYRCKSIRKMGRVDHGDAFLDTYAMEKERGITIFSKQAVFNLGNKSVTLLDTPGHVDFSAEMERTLQVLDYAVLVISGTDGVQGHVMTLWKLLQRYRIPVFLFVNKMDLAGADRERILKDLCSRLDSRCMEFPAGGEDEVFYENLAVCDEVLMERYLETGEMTDDDVCRLIRERKVFPCYFGSALKMEGVDEFLTGLDRYSRCPSYPETFGARVFKIARDAQGNRLTYMKVTGGSLKVKQQLTNRRTDGGESREEIWEQKVDQIRIYSGSQFRMQKEVPAGTVCAVTGLDYTCAGEGLGTERTARRPLLEPVLTYRVLLPAGCDVHGMYQKLCFLEEEDPMLHVVWEETAGEIHLQVMGEVQMEILRGMIKERYGTEVEFGAGSIVYKETIAGTVEGVGHFEPLRHYAEVHLLLEPAPRGTGLVFDTVCSEDLLDKNWQRLILTHLMEKKHKGVLTGSELTDMKITLLAGRAHIKHTEGGDFRQATYRAVRQGLMQAENILLEPVYEFTLEIPQEAVGRAMTDIQKMQGSFSPPEAKGSMAVITGSAPVANMRDYQKEVVIYTRGEGRLFCTLKGYELCHNTQAVQKEIGYDPDRDLQNPSGSVFCSHGAGFPVEWNRVKEYMHLESDWSLRQKREQKAKERAHERVSGISCRSSLEEDRELEEIFTRTFGPVRRRQTHAFSAAESGKKKEQTVEEAATDYLLVDGYNIIFSWEELHDLAMRDMNAARLALMDILSNYQGYRGMVLILVFDAYKVEGYRGEVQRYHNIYVVYTKEAETADQYIEKTVVKMDKNNRITVATSDGIEQVIIMGQGALRMSADGLKKEIMAAGAEIRREYLDKPSGGRSYLFANLPGELADLMEAVRLGKKTLEEEK